MAYRPKPSQTRFGQRVDSPIPEISDTAKMRVLIEQATQDVGHDQDLLNRETERTMAVHADRWREYFKWREGVAHKEQIAMLWKVITALTTAVLGLIAVLWHMIGELAKEVHRVG